VIRNQSGWKFTFVHNLLLQTGRFTPQPFIAEDNLTTALLVGQIYNYKLLEVLLQPSKPDASDGQCILDAYRCWGETFARKFDVEFAIAIFDLGRQQVTISTDQFAIKPMWIAHTQRKSSGETRRLDKWRHKTLATHPNLLRHMDWAQFLFAKDLAPGLEPGRVCRWWREVCTRRYCIYTALLLFITAGMVVERKPCVRGEKE
jgi:asparagine synthetase B (glutamine-hydrolysing)